MAIEQFLGYIFAIFGGCVVQLGALMQKSIVNQITQEDREEPGFMKKLIKNPIWVIGMICNFAGGAFFFIIAQKLIGGALVPGLAASGYIILILGSVKIIKEKITKKEMVAIIFMIFGIAAIGFSSLIITDGESELVFSSDLSFHLRIAFFSGLLLFLWFTFFLLGKMRESLVFYSLSTGIPFALGNIWFQPMLITIARIFEGESWIIVTFLFSAAFAGGANIVGLIQIQHNYKYGNASKIIPIQAIPQQIVPCILYFYVYMKDLLFEKVLFSVIGIGIIIICSFLLASKQATLDAIK
jgi:hypothetical protein